jgi:Protein of unknown function (DUF3093)
MPESPQYDERLGVPLRWWVLAAVFLATLLVAFVVSTPLWVALGSTAALAAVVGGILLGYGAARVSVRAGTLHAGRAHIAVDLLGDVDVLHEAAARRLAGRDADARAFLVLRPYLHSAVRVGIDDPADPAPYWMIATRHPDRLAASLRAAREASAEASRGTTRDDQRTA